jgi:AmmeMemoRadiSam system protein A
MLKRRFKDHQAPDEIAPHHLASLAVERFITLGEIVRSPARPAGLLASRAGTFVTLRTFEGSLRGCIGTVEPVRENVAEEIIHNAIMAATSDPRFTPIAARELSYLSYGVDVLSDPELSEGPEDLDPLRFGVIIETLDRTRRGLLLPLIEGIETIEQQWAAVHHKAGITLGERVRVERFTVTRFGKLDG